MGQFLHRLLFSIFIRDGKNVYRLPRGQLTHVLRHTFAAHFMSRVETFWPYKKFSDTTI